MLWSFFKGQAKILNLLLLLCALAFACIKFNRAALGNKLYFLTLALFVFFVTPFLPRFIMQRLEQQFVPLDPGSVQTSKKKVYIHLLGSGYTLDSRLPATAQLATVAQCRLMEAMRLYYKLDSSVLVCSAGSMFENETQASVARRAAIALGADSNRVITLDTPTSTIEEAAAMKQHIGADSNALVVIVTDASHMPRAFRLFAAQGINAIAAPTNYKIVHSPNQPSFRWAPDINNFQLMDIALHEYLASWVGKL